MKLYYSNRPTEISVASPGLEPGRPPVAATLDKGIPSCERCGLPLTKMKELRRGTVCAGCLGREVVFNGRRHGEKGTPWRID